MNLQYLSTSLNVCRVVIETTSPMAIHSGKRETGFDNQLARDANGLPYIPSSAFVGVWRHLSEGVIGQEASDIWFGTQQQRALLSVSNGIIHNSENTPVLGLLAPQKIAQDTMLAALSQPVPMSRDRVRINDRGVAAEQAKFDQVLLPKGIRFCLSFRWMGDQEQRLHEWRQLLNAVNTRQFALGGSTRNGLGQFKIVADVSLCIDLREPNASQQLHKFNTYQTIPQGRHELEDNTGVFAELELQAETTWRCGNGSVLLGESNQQDLLGALTYSERCYVWKNDKAALSPKPQAILCGSSMKGMLIHRITYYYHCLSKRWADDDITDEQWEQRPEEVNRIFGFINADPDSSDSQAGQLIFTDTIVSYEQTLVRQHNRIDRFTGGVIKGGLFNEELLYRPSFVIKLVLTNPDRPLMCSELFKKALELTLNDIRLGRLSIGSQTGRGNSTTKAKVNGAWQVDWSKIQTFPSESASSSDLATLQGDANQ